MKVEFDLEELVALLGQVKEVVAFPNGVVMVVRFEVSTSDPSSSEVKLAEEYYCRDVIALFNVIVNMQKKGVKNASLRLL